MGLITADEMAFAGGVLRQFNSSYYLHTGQNYWTMTPHYFEWGHATIWMNYYHGAFESYHVDNVWSVRPTLSLKPSVILTGTGTMDDPYIAQ